MGRSCGWQEGKGPLGAAAREELPRILAKVLQTGSIAQILEKSNRGRRWSRERLGGGSTSAEARTHKLSCGDLLSTVSIFSQFALAGDGRHIVEATWVRRAPRRHRARAAACKFRFAWNVLTRQMGKPLIVRSLFVRYSTHLPLQWMTAFDIILEPPTTRAIGSSAGSRRTCRLILMHQRRGKAVAP